MSSLQSLPLEVLTKIIIFLLDTPIQIKDYLHASLVCKRFYLHIKEDYLWKELISRDYPFFEDSENLHDAQFIFDDSENNNKTLDKEKQKLKDTYLLYRGCQISKGLIIKLTCNKYKLNYGDLVTFKTTLTNISNEEIEFQSGYSIIGYYLRIGIGYRLSYAPNNDSKKIETHIRKRGCGTGSYPLNKTLSPQESTSYTVTGILMDRYYQLDYNESKPIYDQKNKLIEISKNLNMDIIDVTRQFERKTTSEKYLEYRKNSKNIPGKHFIIIDFGYGYLLPVIDVDTQSKISNDLDIIPKTRDVFIQVSLSGKRMECLSNFVRLRLNLC